MKGEEERNLSWAGRGGGEQNGMWEGEIKGARAISSIRDRVGMGLEHLCSSDGVGSR